jgi:L-arginine dehydrogenase
MQPLVVDANLAAQAVKQVDVLGAMRRLFRGLHVGKVTQPPQTLALLPDGGGGDFIAYMAALADPPVFGAKLSPYLPRPGGGIVTAWTLLMSSETGAPLMLCDSLALTRERTAATTALAVDLLSPRTATRLALIGCGEIGRAHLRHVLPLRAWQQIRVWSPRAADRAAEIHAAAASASIAGSLREAVDDAEVVMLCTSAAAAVLDPLTLPGCRLVTSISTNAPRAHEIPPARLAELDVYCDARGAAPLAAGEMLIARESGWDPALIRGDLAELVAGHAPLPERTAFFRSIGLGCEDVALAAAIHGHLSVSSAATPPR